MAHPLVSETGTNREPFDDGLVSRCAKSKRSPLSLFRAPASIGSWRAMWTQSASFVQQGGS
jgi:hypothetical protein